MRALKARVSGLALPTYTLDVPGGYGKVPIGPSYLSSDGDGHVVQDPAGRRHSYRPPAQAMEEHSPARPGT
jgi:lysine 2,3-aminomutase